MASIHTDIINRHKRILRQRLKKINKERGTRFKLGQANIDLVFYLKFVRFIKQLQQRAEKIAVIEGSSEVMEQHWTEASKELLENLTYNNTLEK